MAAPTKPQEEFNPAEITERLERTWTDAPGVPGFFNSVDHKRVGHRYLVTSFVFFIIGGIEALFLRAQLAGADFEVLQPEVYNRLFTMHGTTMIFLFAVPMISAWSNYVFPLALGARDMAYPRMNMFSFWVFLFGGIFTYFSFFIGQIPDGGWFAYTPLTTDYSPGVAMDFWSLGVVFLGIATTVGGVNFLVTLMKMRAPGMSISHLPLIAWSTVVTSFMILFSFPSITLGPLLMFFDRAIGTHFFDPSLGGDNVLWQHLFWFWGHPVVYILFLPPLGWLYMVVPTFCKRPFAGYTWAVAATLATGFISFGVWVHHMFATGLPDVALNFFSVASLGVSFPTAVSTFLFTATLWTAPRIEWKTPMLYAIGAIVSFVIGGISGVMTGVIPFDWQAHDTYFVVAHLHYVLVGGMALPMMAAFYYWWPKLTGWMYSERLGKTGFWLTFVGLQLAFFPQHIVGLYGMPRRVYTYPAGFGWDIFNLISTVGAFVFALGILVALVNVVESWVRKVEAGPNPWGAGTLEWATTSPPADYNFAQIPVVHSRYPLWQEGTDHLETITPEPGGVTLAPESMHHETVEVVGLEARFGSVIEMAPPSYWPFWMALSLVVTFSGMLIHNLTTVIVGVVAIGLSFVGWHWEELLPEGEEEEEH